MSSSYDYLKARYYQIEFHRRFALPAACLVLALVGIPLGLSARKGGRSAGFVLTIVLVFIYYFFSLVGVSLARQGKVAPWLGVWAGNFFFFLCGLFLLWRVDRMPLDFSSSTASPPGSARISRALAARFLGSRESRRLRSGTRRPKRRYGAKFPLILDDMILRDFAMYLVMILATFLHTRAGVHLLRVAHRHRPQQSIVHRSR